MLEADLNIALVKKEIICTIKQVPESEFCDNRNNASVLCAYVLILNLPLFLLHIVCLPRHKKTG